MTTLIKQKGDNDCVLASIAMAAGKERWEDVWTDEDYKAVDGKGVSDPEPWLERVGYERSRDYITIYTHHNSQLAKSFLWNRRALVSVCSLNNENGYHMVYWNGKKLYDPSTKLNFQHLSTCSIQFVIIFSDATIQR